MARLKKETNAAQGAVNLYVRCRDFGKPCISCGAPWSPSHDPGHYRTVGAAKQLRFDLDNIHIQCKSCNGNLSGNIKMYRARLIIKIGLPAFKELKNNNEIARYTKDDLIKIKHEHEVLAKHSCNYEEVKNYGRC